MCEYCENENPYKNCIINGNIERIYVFPNGLFNVETEEIMRDINFCPFCGKPLTKKAWNIFKNRIKDLDYGK